MPRGWGWGWGWGWGCSIQPLRTAAFMKNMSPLASPINIGTRELMVVGYLKSEAYWWMVMLYCSCRFIFICLMTLITCDCVHSKCDCWDNRIWIYKPNQYKYNRNKKIKVAWTFLIDLIHKKWDLLDKIFNYSLKLLLLLKTNQPNWNPLNTFIMQVSY